MGAERAGAVEVGTDGMGAEGAEGMAESGWIWGVWGRGVGWKRGVGRYEVGWGLEGSGPYEKGEVAGQWPSQRRQLHDCCRD